jgi:hypothetical protein
MIRCRCHPRAAAQASTPSEPLGVGRAARQPRPTNDDEHDINNENDDKH